MSEERTVTIAIHEEDGALWAEVLELPGCFATGSTPQELQLALEEAVSLYLSADSEPVTAELTATGELTPVREVPARLCLV